MSIIDDLQEKLPYEIQFSSNDGNPEDLYVVLTAWVPTVPGAVLPAPTDNEIGPGESFKIAGTAPSVASARRLRIEVSVPHPAGGGTLIVTQGESQQTIDVTDDSTFFSTLVQ